MKTKYSRGIERQDQRHEFCLHRFDVAACCGESLRFLAIPSLIAAQMRRTRHGGLQCSCPQ
jgi:hypothetical protein